MNEGYSLPFARLPPAIFLRNNRSAFQNSEFVGAAILELLEPGLIIEVNSPPHCVNPLSVTEGKKLRLVLDLREVNRYLVKCNFRYEDLRSLAEVFQKEFWFFTWDLKSGYHHMDIFPPHRQFLGFSWSIAGSTRYFCFSVLPFGLSSACYCFTKLLRPLVKRWRSMSQNCFVYLDDGISGSRDYISARAASNIQRSDLASAGFVTNEEKSNWEPVQIGEWLGFLINTIWLTFQIPPKKLELLVNDGHSTYRSLARLAGFIISLSLAVGPIARIFTRQMHYAIHTRPSWDATFVFSDPLMQELRFWLQNIRAFEGFPLKPTFCADSVLFTDASEFAFGGYVATLGGVPASGMFPESDLHTSSTFREIKAVLYVLQSYAEKLANQSVKIFVDNHGASRILAIGSPKPHLQEVLLEVLKLCFRFGISIEAQWLPREENFRADLLSRFIDKDDWRLNPHVFRMMDKKWGPHPIDRFSKFLNSTRSSFRPVVSESTL